MRQAGEAEGEEGRHLQQHSAKRSTCKSSGRLPVQCFLRQRDTLRETNPLAARQSAHLGVPGQASRVMLHNVLPELLQQSNKAASPFHLLRVSESEHEGISKAHDREQARQGGCLLHVLLSRSVADVRVFVLLDDAVHPEHAAILELADVRTRFTVL